MRKGHRTATMAIGAGLALALAGAPSAGAAEDPPPPGANDFGCRPSVSHPRPVVLVHGFGSRARENWYFMSSRLKRAGYCVFALTYGVDLREASLPYQPGGITRMEDSSVELSSFVDRVLAATGAAKVDLVGHSEGTVMPRYYLERLGGAAKVRRFVSLAPAWRGSEVGGAAIIRDTFTMLGLSDQLTPAICGSCTQSQRGSAFLNDLNADGEAIPGIEHTNIVTRYDELVTPYTSGIMSDGGTNIVLQDVCPTDLSEHVLLAIDPVVQQLVLRALAPARARPVKC